MPATRSAPVDLWAVLTSIKTASKALLGLSQSSAGGRQGGVDAMSSALLKRLFSAATATEVQQLFLTRRFRHGFSSEPPVGGTGMRLVLVLLWPHLVCWAMVKERV